MTRTGWIVRMAWRDSRGSRVHLLLSILAVALGIGALVAIRSFGDRLENAIENQSRTLLGADVSIRSLQPFSEETDTFLRSLPGEQIRETRFFSMITLPRTASTRLSQIRAPDAPFPFYGDFVTVPPEAAQRLYAERGVAVVEENMMIQFQAEIGDTIRIGAAEFTIIGRLINVSGEAPATSAFVGPRVFIHYDDLEQTDLLREGSLARYYVHFKVADEAQLLEIIDRPRRDWSSRRLEVETVEERRAMTGATLDNLNRYLGLGGFIALLLGGIGLAGSIQLYVRQKRTTVSILRCLGADARTAFSIYVVQAVAAALIGSLVGAALGSLLQLMLPKLLADFLPIEIEAGWSAGSVVLSLLYGVGLATAFALYPLVPLRHTAPLHALRAETDSQPGLRIDLVQLAVLVILVLALIGLAIAHTDEWTHGLGIAVGLGAVFILLTVTARILARAARMFSRASWPFTVRQGIANMHRPYNQTGILLLALGLGAFLLATLGFLQHNVIRSMGDADRDGQPNMILFNVQRDQVDPIRAILREQAVEHLETTPIVTMRLLDVNGRTVGDLRDDAQLNIPHWVLFREYRSTYRERLLSRDRIVAGRWQDRVDDPRGVIPVSIEEAMAEHLRIGLGARLTFDVQGVQFRTQVASIRKVNWRTLRTNFFVIFPAGVLEDAPQYFATVLRAPTADASARMQTEVVTRYPNVSAIDLRMLVKTLDDVLDKAAFVIRFMALFSVLTGLVVLGSMVVTSRYDRKADADLLRTLGATRSQINRIMAAEYVVLGAIASAAGLLLALAASWAVSKWVFKLSFVPAWEPLLWIPAGIMAASLLVGYAVNRAWLKK